MTAICTDLSSLAGFGFGAILADPPWSFEVWSDKGKGRSPDNHYETMDMDAIKSLPVVEVAADDSCLFLWAIMPRLPEAISLMEAWGFEYKTCAFTWLKTYQSGAPYVGMGYWTRANAELCLLGTRGKPKRKNKDVQQAILSPVMEHSRKPGVVHERIERLVDGPYLEMFARRITPGRTHFGNEIDRRLFDEIEGPVTEVA